MPEVAVTRRGRPAVLAVVAARLKRSGALRGGSFNVLLASACLLGFVLTLGARQRGALAPYDIRVILHVLTLRDRPGLLAVARPVVHIGDAPLLIPLVLLAALALWRKGYGGVWALPTAALLSWPLELLCKILLRQPERLEASGLVQSAHTRAQLCGLIHRDAVPCSVGGHGAGLHLLISTAVHRVESVSVVISSSFPSGSAIRGAFAIGLALWLCSALEVPIDADLLAGIAAVVALALGVGAVLFAWHWPSDVLGGYLLGFGLLQLALTAILPPAAAAEEPAVLAIP